MIENKNIVSQLVDKNILPSDTEILSSDNNLITFSKKEKIIARIGRLSLIDQREDPGDIQYSHEIAWAADSSSPIVRPIDQSPIIDDDLIVSRFPAMEKVDWHKHSGEDIVALLNGISESFDCIRNKITLKQLDISDYAQKRIDSCLHKNDYMYPTINYVQNILNLQETKYPFGELVKKSPSLVHGDLHARNVVSDHDGNLMVIDLDSMKIGPALYDIASWRVRREQGDDAPVEQAVNLARESNQWDEILYRALIGWKAVSSMTHLLKYGDPRTIKEEINLLTNSVNKLTAS